MSVYVCVCVCCMQYVVVKGLILRYDNCFSTSHFMLTIEF